MTHWSDVYLQQIEDCEQRESCLTDWEQSFISSVREWIESGRRPTTKQTETLDNIWEKATSRG